MCCVIARLTTPLIPLDGLKSGLIGCPLVSTFRGCGQKVYSANNRGHLDHCIPCLTPRVGMLGEVGEQREGRQIGELGTLIAEKAICKKTVMSKS